MDGPGRFLVTIMVITVLFALLSLVVILVIDSIKEWRENKRRGEKHE
jgi:hypothetical protein